MKKIITYEEMTERFYKFEDEYLALYKELDQDMIDELRNDLNKLNSVLEKHGMDIWCFEVEDAEEFTRFEYVSAYLLKVKPLRIADMLEMCKSREDIKKALLVLYNDMIDIHILIGMCMKKEEVA